MRAKRLKLWQRRQAFLYPGLDRPCGGLAPHFAGLLGFGLEDRVRVVTSALRRGSGVERIMGARIGVLVAEVGETHLLRIHKVSRKVIRVTME